MIYSLEFDDAIAVFQQAVYYKPELARAYYKHYRFLAARVVPRGCMDPYQFESYSKATALYKELVTDYRRGELLGDYHFDNLVRFWSR
jgi:hypothetical protein